MNELITVPYMLKGEHRYDGIVFLDFPQRVGATLPPPDDNVAAGPPDADLDTLLSITQSWLSFGLLQETWKLLLAEDRKFTRDAFQRHNISGHLVLSTTSLPNLLSSWELRDRSATTEERIPLREI